MIEIADNVHESQLYDFPLQRGKQSVWTPTAKGGWSQTHLFFRAEARTHLPFLCEKKRVSQKKRI